MRNLQVNYTINNLNVTLQTETESSNLPYNLASLFAQVMRESEVNVQIVLEQLNNEFQYDETM